MSDQGIKTAPPVPSSPAEHLELVERLAVELADALRDASDAGVSHALILPRLVLVFRRSFGEPPAGFVMPTLPGLTS